jgi:hypothetical protein
VKSGCEFEHFANSPLYHGGNSQKAPVSARFSRFAKAVFRRAVLQFIVRYGMIICQITGENAMALLHAQELVKSFGERILFSGVTFDVFDRIISVWSA